MREQDPEEIQVSVVITTYKHEQFIAQCLEAAASQQADFRFEVLVGVDDSEDNTYNICLEIEKKYPDIIKIVLNDKNNVLNVNGRRVGRYNFLNVLGMAKGKYIARCDGDDYWTDPLKLQKQVDFLESHPECVVCHHWHSYAYPDDDGNYVVEDAPTGPGEGYFPVEIASVRDIFLNRLRIKSRTIMFRNLYQPLPDWFHKITYGDVALSMILGARGSFGFINESMAVYRQTGKGASSIGHGSDDYIIRHFIEWIRLWEYGDLSFSGKYRSEADQTVKGFYKHILSYYCYRKDIFYRLLRYALLHSPCPLLHRAQMALFLFSYFVVEKSRRRASKKRRLRKKSKSSSRHKRHPDNTSH